MANQEHLDLLKQGSSAWNAWRAQHKEVQPDLREADLRHANLIFADLSRAHLSGADLREAILSYTTLREAILSDATLGHDNLSHANLSHANLINANLNGADLSHANLSRADLSSSHLRHANLSRADLREAHLNRADLREATLVRTNLMGATLTDCQIYGISAWNVQLEGARQDSLVITPIGEPTITVDNLKIAQFIYLLLNNEEIRDVIDTLTTKSVLVLGRFTPERKAVLDAIREALRAHGYLPILFDFEKPASRDITETISTLAHLARFVVADITDAKSIPQELTTIVPNLPSVPVQPLILASQHEYGMFEHFIRFPWVLPVYRYTDEGNLLQSLQEKVITPAEQKAKELEKR